VKIRICFKETRKGFETIHNVQEINHLYGEGIVKIYKRENSEREFEISEVKKILTYE